MTPVLEPGADSVIGYFPRGLWYDYYTVRSGAYWEVGPSRAAWLCILLGTVLDAAPGASGNWCTSWV